MALRSVWPKPLAIVVAVALLLGGLGLGYAVAHSGSNGADLNATLRASATPTISSVQSATGSSWGSGTVSLSLPSSVKAGDLLVADVTTRGGSTTITPPSGWAEAGSLSSYPGTIDTGIFYEVASSSAASFSFAQSSSQAWAATLREWHSSTGWRSPAAGGVTAGGSTGDSLTLNSGSLTTTQTPELVVAALGWNDAGNTESGLTSGFTSGALGAAGGTISVREAYEVTSATGTFSAQETVSGAPYAVWNASRIAAFLPSGSGSSPTPTSTPTPTPAPSPSFTRPAPTPTPTPAPSTAPPPSGSGPVNCANSLSGSNTISVDGGLYHLQANEYGSGAAFTVCNDGKPDFKITTSGIANATDGAPGAYPSLYQGCHWGDCTTGSGLPVAVSALEGGGVVSTSYATTPPGTGAYDDAYDIWFNPAASTSDNSTGLEVMIWLNHSGPVEPAGSVVASDVSIGGNLYDIWYGGTAPGGTVSYVRVNPVDSVSNLDLGPIAANAVSRGYMAASWFLIDVEAGSEIWEGDQGFTADSFSVTVK